MSQLNIVNRDILTVDKGIIVHCCNTLGVVGGLAEAIANKYPKNLKLYKKALAEGAELGDAVVVKVTEELHIANLLTQSEIGTYKVQTNFDALRNSLKEVKLYADSFKLDVFVPYYIGSQLAGGATKESKAATWETVSKIILQTCPDTIVCKLN